MRLLARRDERVQHVGYLIFLAACLSLCFPYFEATRNANERPRLLQGLSLVDRGELAIDGPASRRLEAGPDVARSKSNGRVYPNKPPGTSVVVAAAYVGARAAHGDELNLRQYTWWARLASGALPTFLLCWFLMRRLGRGFGQWPALGAVSLYALGTPALSYAHLAYGHQLTAALLMVGLALCVDMLTRSRAGPLSRATLAYAALGGLCAATAVTVEYGAVFAGIPIAVALALWARSHSGRLVAAAAIVGALVPILALCAYHDAAFGSPLSTGYHHVVNPEFVRKHGQGLLGLGLPRLEGFYEHILAPGSGLLWWAPLFPLAFYGLARRALHSEDPWRTEARISLGLWVVYLLVISGLSFSGGWRVGPRYLVAILPTLALGWAEVLGQIRNSPFWIFLVVALGIYAFVVNALAANLWPHFDLTNINHPVAEVLLPLWDNGFEPYGLARSAFSIDAMNFVVLLAVVGGASALIRNVELTPLCIGAVLLALLGGLALVYTTTKLEPHPQGGRNLKYIEKSWEPRRGDHKETNSAMLRPLTEAQKRARPRRRP